MTKRLETAIAATIGCFILFVCMHACVNGCTHAIETEQKVQMLDEIAEEQMKVHEAYAAVLHRIWVDNPAYVEQELWNTPEFQTLDSVLHGDFEDLFFFWNKEDSINYCLGWE